MELIKKAVKVGNSAGVLLPKRWLNTRVKVILEPENVGLEILEILAEHNLLKKVVGVYLIGSYARNEQTIDSDVDVLAITSGGGGKVLKGRYEVLCVSKEEAKKQLDQNALPLLAMLKEAKPIINEELLKELSAPLTLRNLRWHIETTRSAMNVVEEYIKMADECGEDVADAAAYSLILRLRTLYIIDCLRKNRLWNTPGLLRLVEKISGSTTAYERYLQVKRRDAMGYKLKKEEAEKIRRYIIAEVDRTEKWLKEKKD
ncbi:MAG TPA: nucleotidyltransferase domain-containing protein [Nanoarchaeota archaeon]|nr:MAG: hypothetical protein QT01_C0001G0038 [archaeon GW2011_AR6]HIH17664.1 nucleotidyltransferase domain-containing protein [Nanoarchaeota archaeon]HIH34404.1 nucleotidyltransferase domain-containing protein [Nanoarchaeota archaeon]HIH51701.1 nucleotidyltransferase domain-containing protein [Nanoarchaeota archaeon]HIH66728.1 nucleotidyltransferase domain-containing protein [Nanoarchaeota archaeon]